MILRLTKGNSSSAQTNKNGISAENEGTQIPDILALKRILTLITECKTSAYELF
jgi:Holliday junction resolvase